MLRPVLDSFGGKQSLPREIGSGRLMACRPTTERIFRVVAGLDTWTPEEEAWVEEHPELMDYQDRLRAAIRSADEIVQRDFHSDFVGSRFAGD